MGTTYSVKYISPRDNTDSVKTSIENKLKEYNNSVSTYIETSVISEFNRNPRGGVADEYLLSNLKLSQEIQKKSLGYFDPTVTPLINAWGFGLDKDVNIDSATIDSLKELVGLNRQISIEGDSIIKARPGVQLNFNAIAKGYGVDVVAQHLIDMGVKNFLVEIGGEVRSNGLNTIDSRRWILGIDKPVDGSAPGTEFQAKVKLGDEAMATSGNYRNFYVKNGKKYAHTIDPMTGYPVDHNLLSASVIARNCSVADAWATGLMAMGLEKSKKVAKENQLDVFLIYDEEGELKTLSSQGFQDRMVLED